MRAHMQWTSNAVIESSLIKTDDGSYLLVAGNGGGVIKFDGECARATCLIRSWCNGIPLKEIYRF
jgi:hypothetical protein